MAPPEHDVEKPSKTKTVLMLKGQIETVCPASKYSIKGGKTAGDICKAIFYVIGEKDGDRKPACLIAFESESIAKLQSLKEGEIYQFFNLSAPIHPREENELTYFLGGGTAVRALKN